jgi:membrane protease YdiL (CAAX protease family)
VARLIEFVVIFLVLPAVFGFTRHRIPAIPALWLLSAYCLTVLLRDRGFSRAQLWRSGSIRQVLPQVLGLFAFSASVIAAGVWIWAPNLFLNMPRTSPWVWAGIMLLYPVASVYPQGIVYRAFLFRRYGDYFQGQAWVLVVVSAFAFAFVHIIFRNWLAVGLTFVGGLLFALRYHRTGSLATSSFEHALYGCLMFTIGLGNKFLHVGLR